MRDDDRTWADVPLPADVGDEPPIIPPGIDVGVWADPTQADPDGPFAPGFPIGDFDTAAN
jgi:hypothetical protein